MTRLSARLLAAAVAAVLICGTATADAAYPNTPTGALRDCNQGHNRLVGHYSLKVLQQALHELKTNSLQYTNCADVLTQAIQALELTRPKPPTHPRSSGKVTRGQAVPTPTTPNLIKKQLDQLNAQGSGPTTISGRTVTPGTVTIRGASFLSSLPTPLLIVLAALLATVIAVSVRTIHQVVRSRRTR
jgi:hypothetical protein